MAAGSLYVPLPRWESGTNQRWLLMINRSPRRLEVRPQEFIRSIKREAPVFYETQCTFCYLVIASSPLPLYLLAAEVAHLCPKRVASRTRVSSSS